MYCSGSGKAFPKFIFAETNTKVSKLMDHIYLYLELFIAVHLKQLFFKFLYWRIHKKRKSAQVDDSKRCWYRRGEGCSDNIWYRKCEWYERYHDKAQCPDKFALFVHHNFPPDIILRKYWSIRFALISVFLIFDPSADKNLRKSHIFELLLNFLYTLGLKISINSFGNIISYSMRKINSTCFYCIF